MLSITLTNSQERVLRLLVNFLEGTGTCYQFTGGFAGNLYGSCWPLHDFDLDVAAKDLLPIAEFLRPYTYHPLGPYEDDEFRLQLLRARVDDVEVDVAQAEGACGRSRDGVWVPFGTNLDRRIRMQVLDMQVWVQPLVALIAYKELIGRAADVAELRTLRNQTG